MSPAENRRSVVIPDDLWERAQRIALVESVTVGRPISMSEWIRTAMEQRIEREGGK